MPDPVSGNVLPDGQKPDADGNAGDEFLPEELWTKKTKVVVDGETQEISVEKAIRQFQKHLGAEKRMQDASESIKAVNLLKKGLENSDADSMIKGFQAIGMTEEQARIAVLGADSGSTGGDGDSGSVYPLTAPHHDDNNEGGGASGEVAQLMETINQLQQTVTKMQQDKVAEKKAEREKDTKNQVDSVIDSDPVLNRMLQGLTAEEQQFYRRAVYATVAEVSELAPQWSLDVARKGVNLFKERQKKASSVFGTGNSTGDQPPLGVGSGKAAADQLYSEANRDGENDKPIKPVKMSEKGWGQYVGDVLDRAVRRRTAG